MQKQPLFICTTFIWLVFRGFEWSAFSSWSSSSSCAFFVIAVTFCSFVRLSALSVTLLQEQRWRDALFSPPLSAIDLRRESWHTPRWFRSVNEFIKTPKILRVMLYARDQITPFLVFESNWGLKSVATWMFSGKKNKKFTHCKWC